MRQQGASGAPRPGAAAPLPSGAFRHRAGSCGQRACRGNLGFAPGVSLRFTKMHGLGNDFAVVDARSTRAVGFDAEQVRRMGDRRRGIGFDQLLVIQPPRVPDCVAAYAIWNGDGTRASQCGNGARCIAAWLARHGTIALDVPARLQAPCEIVEVHVHAPGDVEVAMGEPDFDPAASGFTPPRKDPPYPVTAGDAALACTVVSMGNPHAVVEVADLQAPELARLGPALTAHAAFREGANAGFVRVRDRAHVDLRVHERGAGWTEACGTGACAAMAAMHRAGRVGDEVEVGLPGGALHIRWAGPGCVLWMRGPAAFVYEGTWLDDDA